MMLGKCDMVAVFVPRAHTLLACFNTYTIQRAVAARQGSVHNYHVATTTRGAKLLHP